MSAIMSQVSYYFYNFIDRLRHAISIEMSQNQLIRMLLAVIFYVSVIRPWMVKLAEKEGEKQLAAMEQRDKDKKEKEQQGAAVNALRTGKKPTLEDEDLAATTGAVSTVGKARTDTKARQRAVQEAEEVLLTAEEMRAKGLEDWDEDQEFLKNFSKISDRSHTR